MPLSHLRVVELATILAGPSVGAFFAELGADVIKVENPSGGDPTRAWRAAGETTPDGLCAYFCSINWGKRSLALDLKRDKATLLRLLGESDLLLVNFKPGDPEKLGLSLPELRRTFPSLIIGWITGYGSDNPRSGFDALIQAESGFMLMNGWPGGPPCKLPVALIDLIAGHQLKEGLLLALLQRERSGQGALVEVSLWQSALSALVNQANNWLMAGLDPQPTGSEHPNLFPYGTMLRCQDGEVLVAVGTDRQFACLCEALGDPALAERYPGNADRTRSREALRERLLELSAPLACSALLRRLLALAVPAGQLRSVRQALESGDADAMLLRQGALTGLRTAAFGAPRRDLRPPPRLGQHNDEILANLVGPPSKGGA